MTSTHETTYEPTDEDIQNANKRVLWRISNGRFRTGPGDEGAEQRDNFTGVPTRFGISEEYVNSDNKLVPAYFKLELKTKEGPTMIHCRHDSTQARNLMGALTLWDGLSWISISLALSKKPNVHGKHATYVNVKEITGPGKVVDLRYDAGSADWKSLHQALAAELKEQYPVIYKDYEYNSDESDVMPWAALDQWLRLKGFEEFTGQPEYLEFIRKGTKNATWDANNCTDWAGVQELFAKYESKIPDSMRMTTGPANDEFDPFADE